MIHVRYCDDLSQKVPSVHISPHLMGVTSVLQLAADTGLPKRSDELNLESVRLLCSLLSFYLF